MKKRLTKFAQVAGIMLALAFTFNCSSDKDDDNSGGGGGNSGKGNDIKNYKTVTIGTQTWMAENLDYAIVGSRCYNDDPANCKKYGRLYTLAMADTACPSGWHLPSIADWNVLMKFFNPSCSFNSATPGNCADVGTKLKATSGWNESSGNGTDDNGFSALPGGWGDYHRGDFSGFFSIGDQGCWWSASLDLWCISSGSLSHSPFNYSDTDIFSVRCLKDD